MDSTGALAHLLESNLAGGVILALVLIIFRLVEKSSEKRTVNGLVAIEKTTLERLSDAVTEIRTSNQMTAMALGRLMENDKEKFSILRRIERQCFRHVDDARHVSSEDD